MPAIGRVTGVMERLATALGRRRKAGRDSALAEIGLPDDRAMFMHADGGRDQIVALSMQAGWDAFERPLPALFRAFVARSPGLVIDAGANTGFYALLAACTAPETRVLAFEPDRAVFARLLANVAANPCGARIEAVPLALSRTSGLASLYVPSQEHGLIETSSSLEQAFKPSHSETRRVRTVTLDLFLARHAGRQRVSVIKIDVEGHENAVLAGAPQTIARCRPVVFIEILPRADMAGLSAFLATHGYADLPLFADRPLRQAPDLRFHAEAWNHAFVPREIVAEFERIC